MTRKYGHAIHPQVELGTARPDREDDGLVNGRPRQPWETEILARAREAARLQETAGLLNGVNPKFNEDNGALFRGAPLCGERQDPRRPVPGVLFRLGGSSGYSVAANST